MRVLFIGDVAGPAGVEVLTKDLNFLNYRYKADLTIVNGENSAKGNGIDKNSADAIFAAGADVITSGNHAFQRRSILDSYEHNERLIRPANYGSGLPGKGICELDFGSYKVAVINLMGTAFMMPVDNPFKCADELLDSTDAKVIIVDFHAEATSEKRAMGYYLAGRVSAVFGTHTHVQTADEQIIDGTGYITDVGMTGAADSILGVQKDIIIDKFVNYHIQQNVFAEGSCEICGVLAEINERSGKCVSIERIKHTV